MIAEIQQRSDTTFRLFDYGRSRDLHVEQAVAVANAGVAPAGPFPRALGPGRMLLVTSPYFILEKIDAPPRSKWMIGAQHETWLLILSGHARIGLMNTFAGEAVFLEREVTTLQAGAAGVQALVAYKAGEPDDDDASPGPRKPIPYQRSRLGVGRVALDDVTASAPDSPRGPTVTESRNCLRRKLPAAPLRHRDFHDASKQRRRISAPGSGNLHRRDDGQRPSLRLSARGPP